MALKADGERGISLLEILVVVAIIITITAIAIPNMNILLNSYRLDASGHATASLLQQARLQAVRNNVPAYAQYDTTKSPNLVYVNSDPSVAYVLGNPDVEVTSATFQSSGLPDHSQLDAFLTNGNAGVTAEIAGVIGFNSRGLPCMKGSSAYLCQQQDPVTTNVPYFEWFLKGNNGGWEAVTVTPAGRVRAWHLTRGSGCGYAACWQ